MIKGSQGSLAVALVGLVLGGCASVTADPAERAGAAGAATTVEVTNHNWQDVVVYALHATRRVRLGTVVSMSTERFELSSTTLGTAGSVQLLADPIGSPRPYRTEQILVNPGGRIELKVANSLALSSYAVRR